MHEIIQIKLLDVMHNLNSHVGGKKMYYTILSVEQDLIICNHRKSHFRTCRLLLWVKTCIW